MRKTLILAERKIDKAGIVMWIIPALGFDFIGKASKRPRLNSVGEVLS